MLPLPFRKDRTRFIILKMCHSFRLPLIQSIENIYYRLIPMHPPIKVVTMIQPIHTIQTVRRQRQHRVPTEVNFSIKMLALVRMLTLVIFIKILKQLNLTVLFHQFYDLINF